MWVAEKLGHDFHYQSPGSSVVEWTKPPFSSIGFYGHLLIPDHPFGFRTAWSSASLPASIRI